MDWLAPYTDIVVLYFGLFYFYQTTDGLVLQRLTKNTEQTITNTSGTHAKNDLLMITHNIVIQSTLLGEQKINNQIE